MGNAERAHKNFPYSGCGLSHVTPKNVGILSNISPKLIELETSNLVHGFLWRMRSRCTKISPNSGRGLGHVTSTIFGSTVGYPSDSLASCFRFNGSGRILISSLVFYVNVIKKIRERKGGKAAEVQLEI